MPCSSWPETPGEWTAARSVDLLADGSRADGIRPVGPSSRTGRRSDPPAPVTGSPRSDQALWRTSLSGTRVPRVALPRTTDHGELVRWLRSEHLPGHFPFTAGVFPFKREGEDPARMFAGEGDAFRTNRRASICWPMASRPPDCPPPSIR